MPPPVRERRAAPELALGAVRLPVRLPVRAGPRELLPQGRRRVLRLERRRRPERRRPLLLLRAGRRVLLPQGRRPRVRQPMPATAG